MTDIQSRYYHLIDKVTADFKEQSNISDRDITLIQLKTAQESYRDYPGSESLLELLRQSSAIPS